MKISNALQLAMKKLPGGALFLAAAVYLAAMKPPDPVTAAAVAGLLALAILAMTKHANWAAFGGGLMIAASLFLQSLLSYRCLDCIRADLLILAGVISLSVIDRGAHRRTLGILSAVITVFVAATIAVHYNPPAVFGLERGREVLARPEIATGAVETPQSQPGASGEPLKTAPEDPVRFIQAKAEDGRIITLDAAQKPVLFFSPTCRACVRAVEALAKADPEGGRWVPVQAYGDPAGGRELLKNKGYRGQIYVFSSRWSGMIPTLVVLNQGGMAKIHNPEEMARIIIRGF